MATATSADDRVTATTDDPYAGVILEAFYDDDTGEPLKINFERDGLPVRSGDPAWAPGSIAVAYDHEAPLGVASSWRVQPVYPDGTLGDWSDAAVLTVPAMGTDVDCWVKPCDNPSLAVALEVHTDKIEVAYEPKVTLSTVQGRAEPAASWDLRTPAAVGITLRTDTKAEKDALAAALDVGPVLIQLRTTYGIDDFYAIPMTSTQRFFVGMFSPLRDNPTVFQPIPRPPTIDSSLRVPGRSYEETEALAGTYTASEALWADFRDILFTEPAGDGLTDESGGGGDEGSP